MTMTRANHCCCGRLRTTHVAVNRRTIGWFILGMFLTLQDAVAVSISEMGNSIVLEYKFEAWRLGVAPQPFREQIRLPQNSEREVTAIALVRALQSMEYSIVEPTYRDETNLLEGLVWKTNIVDLEKRDIRQYNLRFSNMSLPTDLVIGVSYTGNFQINGNVLRFEITPILYQRGARSAFRLYERRGYSARYFAERLERRLNEKLIEASRPR